MSIRTVERVQNALTFAFVASLVLAFGIKIAFGSQQRTIALASIMSAGDLSATAVSSTIDMCPTGTGNCYTNLTMTANVTAGTTTAFQVTCETSSDNATWAWVNTCASGTCSIQDQSYDVSSKLIHEVPLTVTQRYIRCTYDDSANGTGTVNVSATLSKETGR